jgi:hypothetical protein
MGLRLNKLADDRILESLPHTVRRIETSNAWLTQNPSPDIQKLIRCHEGLAQNHLDAGLRLYQLERNHDEVAAHLHSAARHAIAYFQLLQKPSESEMRQFSQFEQLLNLLICFGTAEMRNAAGGIPKEIYHFTTGSHYKESYAPSPPEEGIIEYLEILKNVAGGKHWDESAYQHAQMMCRDEKATRRERVVTLAKLGAVWAEVHGNSDIWNQKITEIVTEHKQVAMRGDWKHDINAFICLPGLAMAQLGRQRGLTCALQSPYLPLDLLQRIK